MAAALRFLTVCALGVGLVGTTTGCEECEVQANEGDTTETRSGFCSLERFEGTPRTASETWEPGTSIAIDSRNGEVDVVQGNADQVNVTFEPVVWRAFNVSEEEVRQNFEQLVTNLTRGADGNIVIETKREGEVPSTLGADVTVELPSNFDSQLLVVQDNGFTDIDFVGDATALTVDGGNGSVEANAGSVATLDISIEDTGSVDATLAGIAEGATGGSISTNFGDIELGMPIGPAYSVQATSEDGVVEFIAPPTECSVEEAAANSKTLSCDTGGPNYTASAGGLNSDVTVTFD